jgi:hypothetical protein
LLNFQFILLPNHIAERAAEEYPGAPGDPGAKVGGPCSTDLMVNFDSLAHFESFDQLVRIEPKIAKK